MICKSRRRSVNFCMRRILRYEGEPISRAVALALYGRHPYGSITRLERFAACAYAHFLQYGLKLTERETSAFESVDMGNIYHTALERYSRKLEQSEYDWFVVPDAVRRQMAENAMQEAYCRVSGYGGLRYWQKMPIRENGCLLFLIRRSGH